MNRDEFCRKNYVGAIHCGELINDELKCKAARKADEAKRREANHPVDVDSLALFTITSTNHDELCRKNFVEPAHCED